MRMTIDKNGKAVPFIRGVLVGIVTAVLMLFTLSLITAYFINKEILSVNFLGYVSIVILFVATQSGGVIGIRMVKRRVIAVIIAISTSICVLLLLLNWLLLGSVFDGTGTKVIVIYLASATVALVELKRKQKLEKKVGMYRI
jgi:hypothetical protein